MATFRLSSGTTSAAPASFVPVVGDYTVVFVYAIGNTNTAPTCSDDNGGTYTLITAQLLNASASVLSLFVRDQPFSNTTATTITPSVGTATSWRATFESYSGMQRSGLSGVRQFAVQANQASGTTPAATFSASALTTNPTLGGVADSTVLTAPTSWTSQASGGKLQVVTRDSGFTGTTITWGSTDGANYATIIVELDASAPQLFLRSPDFATRSTLAVAAMQSFAFDPKPGPQLTPAPGVTPAMAEYPDQAPGRPITHHRAPSYVAPTLANLYVPPNVADIGEFPESAPGRPVTHHRAPFVTSIAPLPIIDKPYGANLTSAGGFYSTGASSIWSLVGDGYFEWAVTDAYPTIAVGLSTSDPDTNYATIGWAMISNSAGGFIALYELGVFKTQVTPNKHTSLLRIQRAGTTMTYYLDNVLIYTSLNTTSAPLFIDIGFNGAGSFTSLRLNDAGKDVPIRWTSKVGVTAVDSFESVGEAITPDAAVFPDRALGRPIVHHRAPDVAQRILVYPVPLDVDKIGDAEFPDIVRGRPVTHHLAPFFAHMDMWPPPFLPVESTAFFPDFARGLPITHHRAPFSSVSNLVPIGTPAVPVLSARSGYPDAVPGRVPTHHRAQSLAWYSQIVPTPSIAATLSFYPPTVPGRAPTPQATTWTSNLSPLPNAPVIPVNASTLGWYPDRVPASAWLVHRLQSVATPARKPDPDPMVTPAGPSPDYTFVLEIEDGAQTTYAWATDIIPTRDGHEQRISPTGVAAESYQFSATMLASELAQLEAVLFTLGATAANFYVALSYESLLVESAAGVVATVDDTSQSDYLYQGARWVGVPLGGGPAVPLVLQTATATTLTFDVGLGAAVVRWSRLMPIVQVALDPQQSIVSWNANAGTYQLSAHAMTFGVLGRGATVTTLGGIPVFDRRVRGDNEIPRSPSLGTEVLDLGGAIRVIPSAAVAAFVRQAVLSVYDETVRQWLKAFVGTVRGRQKVFLLPTWTPDITPISLVAGTLTISNAPDYVNTWWTSAVHRWVQVQMTDGTTTITAVDTAVDNHDGTQTLGLHTAPGAGTIAMVSVVELCRLADDKVIVQWASGQGVAQIPIQVVRY